MDSVTHLRKDESIIVIDTGNPENEKRVICKDTNNQEVEFQVNENTEDQENEVFQVIENTEDQEKEEFQVNENTEDQENEVFQVIENTEDQENEKIQVIETTEDQEREKNQVYKNEISIFVLENEEIKGIENTEDQKNEEIQVIDITEDQKNEEIEIQVVENDAGIEDLEHEKEKMNNTQGQKVKKDNVIDSSEDQQYQLDQKKNNKLTDKQKCEEDQVQKDDEDNKSADEGGEPRLVMECESDGCPDIFDDVNDKEIVIFDSSAPQQLRDKGDSSTSELLKNKGGDGKKEQADDSESEKKVNDKLEKTKRKSRGDSQQTVDKTYRCSKCVYESKQYSDYVLHNCKPSTGISFTVSYHSDGKIFSCTCGHIYHKLKTFHEHLVTHLIPKPYRCSLCKEVFSTRKEIMKHLTAVHPIDEMRFYVNGLKFTQNILDKARKTGSYTHFDKHKSKSVGEVINNTESIINLPTSKDVTTSTSNTVNANASKNVTPSTSYTVNATTSKDFSQSTSNKVNATISKDVCSSTSNTENETTSKYDSPSTSNTVNSPTSKYVSTSTSNTVHANTRKDVTPSTSYTVNATTSKDFSQSTSNKVNATISKDVCSSTSNTENETTSKYDSLSTSNTVNSPTSKYVSTSTSNTVHANARKDVTPSTSYNVNATTSKDISQSTISKSTSNKVNATISKDVSPSTSNTENATTSKYDSPSTSNPVNATTIIYVCPSTSNIVNTTAIKDVSPSTSNTVNAISIKDVGQLTSNTVKTTSKDVRPSTTSTTDIATSIKDVGPSTSITVHTKAIKYVSPSTSNTVNATTSKTVSPSTSSTVSATTIQDNRPSTSNTVNATIIKDVSQSTSNTFKTTSKVSIQSTIKTASSLTSKAVGPSTSYTESSLTSKAVSPSTSNTVSSLTSNAVGQLTSNTVSSLVHTKTIKYVSPSTSKTVNATTSKAVSPSTSSTISSSTSNTVSSLTSNTSSSTVNATPKPLTCKSVSLLNSKNLGTSVTEQLRVFLKRPSKGQSLIQSDSQARNLPKPTNQKGSENVIIIDDDDDDDDNDSQKDNVNFSCQQIPKIEIPHPVGLFKNVGQTDIFQFHFSSCGVKYSCTYCKKEWESRSHFCFHIWQHQHANDEKCSECDQKTGESGVSCLMTIKLFRKLAFASFTKIKQLAEEGGALKDLALNQIQFCSTNGIRSYKCLECNMDLPQLGNLKWHIWQHSHSSIICPACSIMRTSGIRYIICPLVEKLVSKIQKNEEHHYSLLAGTTAQTIDSGATASSGAYLGQKFGMINKKNETLFVCYICSKQWTNKQTFWLHAWTHYHKDKQLCPKCKKSNGFPGMKCSLVDKAINIPEFFLTTKVVETEEFTKLEEDMIITSNDSANRPQEDHDIIIIDDTPGPGETDANPNIINLDEETGNSLNDLSGSLNSTYFEISTEANVTNSGVSLEDDVAEVIIDKADVNVSDSSFLSPSTSKCSSQMASTDVRPNQIVVLNPEPNLFLECNFPKGLIRSFLTEPSIAKAISKFLCVYRNGFMCLICKDVSFGLDELIHLYEHILVQHMKIPLVKCGYCDFKTNKEHNMKGHLASKHCGKEINIVKYQLDFLKSVNEYSRLIAFNRSRSLPDDYAETNILTNHLDALRQKVSSFYDSNETDAKVKENQDPEPAGLDVKFEVELNDTVQSDKTSEDAGPMILSAYSLASSDMFVEPSLQKIKPEIESLASTSQVYFSPNFYACGSCTYSTLIMEDLRKHLFTKHSTEKKFPCRHCGFVGLRTDQLLKHFVHHTNNNSLDMPVFQCIDNNCEYRCNNLEGFLIHLENHNFKQYECHECAETMGSLKELEQHLKLNLLFIYSCPFCSAVATNSEKMKDHIKSYHDGAIPREWTISKQLVCRDRQLYNYNSIFNIETQKSNLMSTIEEVEELNCKWCSFYGVTAADLKSHIEVHSKIQEDKAFICPFCASPFDGATLLTDHFMKHAETQMSLYFFTCKIDNYCTNVYQKVWQHIHDGQHVLTGKPEDMFDYRQVTYKSQVICCPRCPFKSACRGYLTCHIERVHNGNVGTVHSKGADSPNDIVNAQTEMLTCPEENCTFCTPNSKELHQHIKTHSQKLLAAELTQGSPFKDINKLKKRSHIFIPTDGPDDQENFHLLETRVKTVYIVGKDSYKCKICKIHKQEQVQMMKHLLMKHFGLHYCCYMCPFSSPLLWRMRKHGKVSHHCKNFNIIYSDKIEEVIKKLLEKKGKNKSLNTKDDKESKDVRSSERRVKESQLKESKQTRPNESQKANSVKDTQQKPKTDGSSISPSVELPIVKFRGRKRKESEQDKGAVSKKQKTDRTTRNADSVDAISISKPKSTQQLPPTEADKFSVKWSTLAPEKYMCLLGSKYLDSSFSVLYQTDGNRHQCHVCKEWFPAVTRYWIHHHLNLNHLKLSLYKCGYCEWRAIEKFKIHQHISKFHPKEGIKVQDANVDVSLAVFQYIRKNRLGLKLPEVKETIDHSGDNSSASISSSSNMKQYKCGHCEETFEYTFKAKIHTETAHVGLEPNIMVMYRQAIPNSNPDNSKKRKSTEESHVLRPKKTKKAVEKLLKCPQCTFYTDVNLDAMLQHFKSHNYEKIIECSTCGVRSFDDKASKKHHRLCHQAQPEKSNLLPVTNFFKTIEPKDAPTSMLACLSIDKPFKFNCKYCHLKSDADNVMRDHLLQHLENLKPHIVCSVCSVPIPEVVLRLHHFQNVHSSTDNTKNLDLVNKALNDVLLDCLEEGTLREEPPESNLKFMCMKCPQKFHCLSSLSKHYKTFHRLPCGINTFWKDKITGCVFNFLGTMCKNSPKIVDLSKFDVFLCPACDFRTNDRDLLYNHQRANHLKQHLNRTMELCYSREDTPSTSSGPKYLSFRCLVCPEISKSLSEYSEHISCHGNIFKKLKPSISNIVRCRNCSYVSDSVSKINDHVKTHVTLKQFVCAYCSFEANQSTVVKLHLKSAHPYKTLTGSIVDLKSPRHGNLVDFRPKVRLKNFFEMTPHEFENLLNSADVQDVDLSRVPLKIAEKLLLAY